ncbi:MAG: DUF3857 domain-containing protein [Bacteroidales bacterium]|jgi:hypothetical protein|nr:DUF3857 domain-containing protein [Bacteroidales bacterium]
MKLKHILYFTAIVLLAGSCQKSTTEEHDALFKSIKKVYELKPDGSMNYHYQHQLKYITHLSFNRMYGESFIIYHPDYQELTFNTVETTMADGKVVKAPENAFNKVLPRFAAGAPAFNHLREMVVTHTGLELGCTVNFDYEIHSRAGYLPFINENIILQEDVPVEQLEIVVKVPEGTELNYTLLNLDTEAKVSSSEGYTQYSWKFKNLNNRVYESNQPEDQRHLPRLIFANVTPEEALQQVAAEDSPLNDEIRQYVTQRITGKKKEIHIIRELQKLVGDEINDFNIPLEYARYTPRTPDKVWQSNGATPLEKSILLNKMLNFSGIKSELTYAQPSFMYDQSLGILNGAGEFYNVVTLNGEKLVLTTDARQANNQAFYLKDHVLLDIHGQSIDQPVSETEAEPEVMVKANFQLNSHGELSGRAEVSVLGANNPYLNYLDQVENAREVIQSVFPGNTIQDYEVKQFDFLGNKLSADIEQKELWKNQGDYYIFSLPRSSYGIEGEHIRILLQERETPLQLSQTINETYEYTVKLPEGFVFTAPEITRERTNTLGSVSITITEEDNTLNVSHSLTINQRMITPEEYHNFLELMHLWRNETFQEIILKKIQTEN